MTKIAAARGHMERGNLTGKGENIGWTISIIAGLKGSLNLDAGGILAGNLDRLYEYMLNCLSEANISNDIAKLDEVSELLGQISSGWQGIKDQVDPQAAPEAVSHAAS
jgi:flagellar protein FliS